MKKRTRVIVIYNCSRHYENCCNEHIRNVPEVIFTDLLKYEELVITGGEPVLLTPRVLGMIRRLWANGYEGKIWLYISCVKTARWANGAVLEEVDGITYTSHHKSSQTDLRDARKLSKCILDNFDNRRNRYSDGLLIDSRCYTNGVLTIIGFDTEGSWGHQTNVRYLKWKDDECPLPEDGELVFYDLEKEQKGKQEENEWTFIGAHMWTWHHPGMEMNMMSVIGMKRLGRLVMFVNVN